MAKTRISANPDAIPTMQAAAKLLEVFQPGWKEAYPVLRLDVFAPDDEAVLDDAFGVACYINYNDPGAKVKLSSMVFAADGAASAPDDRRYLRFRGDRSVASLLEALRQSRKSQ